MINLILFGPPGSGKGTQAKSIAEKYDLIHISTGDLFRYEIGNNTPLGQKAQEFMDKGELVPDSVTVGMLENKMNMHPDSKGFIFDGFPRTTAQAEAFQEILDKKEFTISHLVSLDVEENELVKRLLERGKTSGRSDDADESVIRNRISVYHEQTSPVYNYYDKDGVAKTINGIGTIDEIFSRLCAVIDS